MNNEIEVGIPAGEATLDGNLTVPDGARGIVLFVHGSGSSRHSPRNRFVAQTLNSAGLATLLFDLLTPDEESRDIYTGEYRFDIGLLAERLGFATDWVLKQAALRDLRIGYFGSSTGGGAALIASVERPEQVVAIFCLGSRTDMATGVLARVTAPTLLIVGECDDVVLQWNRESFAKLRCKKQLQVISDATHLFEEPGTLEQVARLASKWFTQHAGISRSTFR